MIFNDGKMILSCQLLPILADFLASDEATDALPLVPNYEWAFAKMLFTLLLLIGSLVAAIWFLKKMAPTRFGGSYELSPIKLLARQSISSKTTLYLLEIEGQSVVIAESQFEITVISSQKEIIQSDEGKS